MGLGHAVQGLTSAFNSVVVTQDTATDVGDLDGWGSSLSAQALGKAGVSAGSTVSHNGLDFVRPAAAGSVRSTGTVTTGGLDNVVSSGQTVAINGTHGSTLGFLVDSSYGPAAGPATIRYSDGKQGPAEVRASAGPCTRARRTAGPSHGASPLIVDTGCHAAWDRIEPLMPADPVRGRRWADHRRTLEATAWKYRTNSPWRDLPPDRPQTADQVALDGTWEMILAAVLSAADADDDIDWTVSVDSTVLRAHQHASGARRSGRAAPGNQPTTLSDAPAAD